METTTTETAASSPAPQTFEIPSDPKANLEWRTSGKLPGEATPKEGTPKEASTPSNKNASAEEDSAETAAASATATKQEKTKQLSPSATRLNELLADLKKAGLSPEELKTFKREAQAAKTEPPANAAPEKTVNPQGPELPVKPKWGDTKPDGTNKWDNDWEKFDEAKDQYHDAMADYRAKAAVLEDRQLRAAEAQQQTFTQKITEAKARYGDQTEATIGNATRSLLDGGGIPLAVQDLIGGSPVLMDVMYALGSDPAALESFVDLAKSDPAAAIRKFVLLEHLTTEELQKSAAGGKSAGAGEAAAERGEDGKFVSKPPAKQRPAAPPPPEELNTRGSAPPDEIASAMRRLEAGDVNATRVAIDALNRRDIARRRGA